MDFQQFAYNRNDNHPMMPQVKMEPGIKQQPVDNVMHPQVDAMMQQLDKMTSPQLANSPLDGMTHQQQQQQQYTQQMQQQQQQFDLQQQQQYQMQPGMTMPPHTMGMNMGPTGQPVVMMNGMPPGGGQLHMLPAPGEEKKKGRKKKLKQEKLTDGMKEKKPRKKFDRFHGMPEEEVVKRTLPDLLVHNLDIVIVGINPGLMAAYKGHHYAGPGNHFWKCLYLSGFIPEPMTCMDDVRLKDYGIGFTNIVQRTTRGSADLTRKEIKEGGKILAEKMQIYKPLIACFNGKGIYEIFSGKKDFEIGRQPETIPNTDTVIFVMPSSSARCSQFPRAQDKVKFYLTLKELRNDLKGIPNEPRPPEYQDPPADSAPVQPKPSNKKVKKEAQQQQVKQEGDVQQQPQMQMSSVQQQQQMQQQPQQGVQVKQEPGLYNANQQGSPQQTQQQQVQQQQQQQGVQIKQEPVLYNTSQQGCLQQQMQNSQQMSNQQQHQQQQQQQQQQGVQIKQEPGIYNSAQQVCPQQQMPNQQQMSNQQQQYMQQPQMSQQQQQQQMGMQQMSHQQQMQMQQQQQMSYQHPGMHIKQEPGLYNTNRVCPQTQQSGIQQGVSPPAQGMQQSPQGMPYYPPHGQQPHPNLKQEPLDRYSQQPGVCQQYPTNNSYPPQYAHPMPNIKQEAGTMGMGHFIDRIPNIGLASPTGVTSAQSMVNSGSPGLGHPQMGPNAGSPAGMVQTGAPNQGSPSLNSAGELSSFGEAFQLLNSTVGLPPT